MIERKWGDAGYRGKFVKRCDYGLWRCGRAFDRHSDDLGTHTRRAENTVESQQQLRVRRTRFNRRLLLRKSGRRPWRRAGLSVSVDKMT